MTSDTPNCFGPGSAVLPPVVEAVVDVEVDAAPIAETPPPPPPPDLDPCPGAVSPTARDKAVSPCDPPATAVMAPCAAVVENDVHSPINALVMEPEDETPGERFVRLDQAGRAGIRAGFEAGFAFLEIRDDELWRDGGYVSWRHYCETILETSPSYISRLIDHALINGELLKRKPPRNYDGEPILPAGESVSRPLKKLPGSKERARAWRLAVKRADGSPTAKIVTDVVAEFLGNAAVKAGPSRGEQRLNLQRQLYVAVDAAESWELVRELVNQLIALK